MVVVSMRDDDRVEMDHALPGEGRAQKRVVGSGVDEDRPPFASKQKRVSLAHIEHDELRPRAREPNMIATAKANARTAPAAAIFRGRMRRRGHGQAIHSAQDSANDAAWPMPGSSATGKLANGRDAHHATSAHNAPAPHVAASTSSDPTAG